MELLSRLATPAFVFVFILAVASTGACVSQSAPSALSDEDLEAFGRRVESTILADDLTYLRSHFDFDQFTDRVMEGLDLSSRSRREIKDSFAEGCGFIDGVVKATSPPSGFKFLRVRSMDGQRRVLFRVLPDGGGVNYHDMVVESDDHGSILVVDVFVYVSGEFVSKVLRRAILPHIVSKERGILDRLIGRDSEYMKSYPMVDRFIKLAKQGMAEEAMGVYRDLPRSVQVDKNLLIMRINFAESLGNEAYQEAMAEFMSLYPGDPALLLILLDKHFLDEDWASVLGTIDRVERVTGPDAHLDQLRASVYSAKNDLDRAKSLAEKATVREPTLEDAWWVRVDVSMRQEDHAETARLLSHLEGELGVVMKDVSTLEFYKPFVESDAYRKWMESRQ